MGAGASANKEDVQVGMAGIYRRSSTRFYNSDPEARRITYVSDVEGHWDYFCNWVELSPGVRFCSSAEPPQARTSEDLELELEDGWDFVYGGDSCDKGPGTLRFLEAIVRLKKKHPDRVHLLLGNRDVNKIRWTAELAESELARINDLPIPFWIKKAATHKQYIQKLTAAELGVSEKDVTEAMILERNTKANKMKYMLDVDMGSQGEFDFRREELAYIKGINFADVTDEDVIRSYEDSLKPGGWMREYLMSAQLCALLGGCLFVHGQIIGNQFLGVPGADANGVAWSLGVVPGVEDRVDSVEEWVASLNAWAKSQLEQWEASPTWHVPPTASTFEAWSGRGGAELIAYGTPSPSVPTVVYCRWLTEGSMPLKYPPELVAHLTKQGIRYVVVGHTPHGNAPTIIPNGDLMVVMGDTSYSHMKSNLAYRGDNRGVAASDICFLAQGVCQVRGYTDTKQVIDYRVHPLRSIGDPYVGLIQEQDADSTDKSDHFFVKALLPALPGSPQDSYLMSSIQGYKYEYLVLNFSELQDNFGKNCALPRTNLVVCESGELSAAMYDEEVLKLIFQTMDRNRDGAVAKTELLAACTRGLARDALMIYFPNMDLDQIFAELDVNNDGTINFEECLALLTASRPE